MEIKTNYQTVEIDTPTGHYECVSVAQAADDLCATPNNVMQWVRRETKTGETSLDYIKMFQSKTGRGVILIPKNQKYNELLAKRILLRINEQIDNGKQPTLNT